MTQVGCCVDLTRISHRIWRMSQVGECKRQITSEIDGDEVLDRGKQSVSTYMTSSIQSVFSVCLAKRAKAVRDSRSILARTALSLRFCLVAA